MRGYHKPAKKLLTLKKWVSQGLGVGEGPEVKFWPFLLPFQDLCKTS
jgi:hypothetical protein